MAFPITEHTTASDTINPDAASARGSLTVAAIRHDDAGLDTPEPFSSRGPKTRLFDVNGVHLATPLVLQKPQLAGADNVATSVPGFNPFAGTSAATPSAAGVAILVRQANPTMPLAELAAIMTDPVNTSDCSLAGLPDLDCGFGFIFADRAVTQALDPTPPEVAGAVTPAAPTGRQWLVHGRRRRQLGDHRQRLAGRRPHRLRSQRGHDGHAGPHPHVRGHERRWDDLAVAAGHQA